MMVGEETKAVRKAVDQWGQSMEITWLIDPEDRLSSSPSASSDDPSRASHPSPSSGDSNSDSDSDSDSDSLTHLRLRPQMIRLVQVTHLHHLGIPIQNL